MFLEYSGLSCSSRDFLKVVYTGDIMATGRAVCFGVVLVLGAPMPFKAYSLVEELWAAYRRMPYHFSWVPYFLQGI